MAPLSLEKKDRCYGARQKQPKPSILIGLKNMASILARLLTPFDDPLHDINLSDPNHQKKLKKKAFLPQVKMIVVDSLKGANTGVENDSQIFEIVKFLAELARDTGKIVILIHHLRKKGLGDDDIVTLDHIRGSSAITQTTRMVWAINSKSNGSKENTFQVIKSNLGEFPPAIGFQITEDGVDFFEPAPNLRGNIPKLERRKRFCLIF